MLVATVESLIRHEIALREPGAEGVYLVFPSQFTRETPEMDVETTEALWIRFEGSVQHIYATLVVRLARSGLFQIDIMWKNGAQFRGPGGARCAVRCEEVVEGAGQLTFYFESSTPEWTSALFEDYAVRHLIRRASRGSIDLERIVTCAGCRWRVPRDLIDKMVERGRSVLTCPACQETFDVVRARDLGRPGARRDLVAMDRQAHARTLLDAEVSTLPGKIATDDFDVFLAHNGADQAAARILSHRLRQHGLYPWLDEEQIAPGMLFQDVIQQALSQVRTAAVLVGTSGLGKWEAVEARAMVSQCVERGIPVIPVLLPGVSRLPKELVFLAEYSHVSFEKSIEEPPQLARLVWGITGDRLRDAEMP